MAETLRSKTREEFPTKRRRLTYIARKKKIKLALRGVKDKRRGGEREK